MHASVGMAGYRIGYVRLDSRFVHEGNECCPQRVKAGASVSFFLYFRFGEESGHPSRGTMEIFVGKQKPFVWLERGQSSSDNGKSVGTRFAKR
jgi:hypothetical protein